MDLGTGIGLGGLALAVAAVLIKLIGNRKNNNNKKGYLLLQVFDEYKEGTTAQLSLLAQAVKDVRESDKRAHDRIYKITGSK